MNITTFLKSLYRPRNSTKNIQEIRVVMDPWIRMRDILAEKLAEARAIDVQAVALKAGSSVESVEEALEYPALWVEFGDTVQADHKSLKDFLDLGWKILKMAGHTSTIWEWYKTYAKSVHGWGEIHPREYLYMRDRSDWIERYRCRVENTRMYVLDRTEGIVRNMLEHQLELNASDVGRLNYLGEPLEHELQNGDLYDVYKDLLSVRLETCRGTEEGLLAFIDEIPACLYDGPNLLKGDFYCACNHRHSAMRILSQSIRGRIEKATSFQEVEAIKVPNGLRHRFDNYSRDLKQFHDQRLNFFQKEKESEKIRKIHNG